MKRVAVKLIELPCAVLHRMWWVPLWNRSAFLSCPVSWMCNHSDQFRTWYWDE